MAKLITRTALLAATLSGLLIGYLAYFQFSGNFCEVTAGSVYRAALHLRVV